MKIHFFLLLLALSSCNRQAAALPPLAYQDFLEKVKTERHALKNASDEERASYFFRLINEHIPAYWAGTPWDFNGVSRVPQKGEIACGYFITNTLTDLGVPVERVKMAQVASSVMIENLCVNTRWISGYEAFKTYMNGQPDGSVFIVGLDFHTGYITKDNDRSWFIHSNYINRKGVMKELIGASEALKSSKVFMIGNLGANASLLKKWSES